MCLAAVTRLVVQSAHVLNSMNAAKVFHDITQSPSLMTKVKNQELRAVMSNKLNHCRFFFYLSWELLTLHNKIEKVRSVIPDVSFILPT